jgi:hypothetical protein
MVNRMNSPTDEAHNCDAEHEVQDGAIQSEDKRGVPIKSQKTIEAIRRRVRSAAESHKAGAIAKGWQQMSVNTFKQGRR